MTTQSKVVMYGNEMCPYCGAARTLLVRKGIDYEFIVVSNNDDARQEMARRSGNNTVPQIFINDESIGGFDELYTLEQSGRLDPLLEKT